jgi:hypothetical protein
MELIFSNKDWNVRIRMYGSTYGKRRKMLTPATRTIVSRQSATIRSSVESPVFSIYTVFIMKKEVNGWSAAPLWIVLSAQTGQTARVVPTAASTRYNSRERRQD